MMNTGLHGQSEMSCSAFSFIPAKPNSRRVPGKNLALVNGIHLFEHSILTSLQCNNISKTFVSTNSNHILSLCSKYDISCISRGPNLENSMATNTDVLIDFLRQLSLSNQVIPSHLVLLQPTHPLRNPEYIDDAISYLFNNPHIDSVFSAFRVNTSIAECNNIPLNTTGIVAPASVSKNPNIFINAGNFYVFKSSLLTSHQNIFGDSPSLFILPPDFIDIDIDYPSQLKLANSFFNTL